MRTPDEIKRGLECLVCYGLGCDGECDTCSKNTEYMGQEGLMQDALTYIQQLERQNAEQAARLEQVTRERDAALAEFKRYAAECEPLCWTCKFCEDGVCISHSECVDGERWKWRGVPREGEHDV